jgi:hypothetical protein
MVIGDINYIENKSFTYAKWIEKDITMHPSINVSINFNEFIKNM